MERNQFEQILSDTMYRTIGKIRSSTNTCSVHHELMFKKMHKKEAEYLLNLCEHFSEFHDDTISYYRKIINQKNES